jgi:glycosyltransferase involved in cell wall biosynthesis
MKILILASKIPWPLVDGGRIATYEPMRHLTAHGHRIGFLGFGPQSAADELRVRASLFFSRAIQHNTQTDILSAALSLFSPLPYTAGKYRAEAMTAAMREAFQEERFDLVQVEGTQMAHYLGEAQRRGVPTVLRLHNVEADLAARYARTVQGPLRWFVAEQARRMRRFEAAACRQASLCLAITEEDAAIVRSRVPEAQVAVSPAGVDLERYAPHPMSEEPGTVVFIGALDWPPNADSVRWFRSEIWPRVRREESTARWVLVGKGPSAEMLRWPEEDRSIQVTGYVEDVRLYLNSASLVVAPIRSGGGMRLKILEALASGKPVVSTPIGAEGISFVPGRDLVLADKAAAFASEVVRLLRDPAERFRMGQNARQTASLYGWEDLIHGQEEIYRQLISWNASSPDGFRQ